MNPEYTTTRPAPSYLIPFSLLAISFAVLLVYQIINLNKQHASMQETKQQMITVIEQREALVKQSGELQSKLQALAVDLLALAQTNDKAKAIVQKYNIQQNAPAPAQGQAPQPTPAPAPAP